MKYIIKIEDIVKKHPFIYEVEGSLYYIGNGVFRSCNDPISYTYYENYKKYIDVIGRERIAGSKLNNDEINNLLYYFKRILMRSDFDRAIDEPIQARKNTLQFLLDLSEESSAELIGQLEDFVVIYKYYYK